MAQALTPIPGSLTGDLANSPANQSVSSVIPEFERIFIDRESLGSSVALRVHELFSAEKIEIVDGELPINRGGDLSATEFDRSKRLLHIRPFPGQFFKRCPGATQKKVLACCNYHVLNLGQQCNFNCSYCYLQSYLNTRTMQIYSNIDQAIVELREMTADHGELPFRVGTGEVIDSLSLDPLTLYSRQLIEFFREFPKWTLEFKTKSDLVDQFLDCDHAGNVVVSWSINPSHIIESEEHGTARLHQRLSAARKCANRGFPIAFHIDPMIWFEDWKPHYESLVREVTDRFSAREINVISVGALRFQPSQRHLMRERFGMKSLVTSAEVFPSEGGKLRYDSRLRQEMFQFVVGKFKAVDPAYRIFFCMETPETWISAYDNTPMKVPGLQDLFRPLPKVDHLEIQGLDS